MVEKTLSRVRSTKQKESLIKGAFERIKKGFSKSLKTYELIALHPRFSSVVAVCFLIVVSSVVLVGSVTLMGRTAGVEFQRIADSLDVNEAQSRPYKTKSRDKLALKKDLPRSVTNYAGKANEYAKSPKPYEKQGAGSGYINDNRHNSYGMDQDGFADGEFVGDEVDQLGTKSGIRRDSQIAEQEYYKNLSKNQQLGATLNAQRQLREGSIASDEIIRGVVGDDRNYEMPQK